MREPTCSTCGQPWPTDTPSVPVAVAARMLQISRSRVYQLLDKDKLKWHPDGGIARESVLERLSSA